VGNLASPHLAIVRQTYEDFSITTAEGREEAFGQDDHVRIYAKDYPSKLAQAGFEVSIFNWRKEANKFGNSKNTFGLNHDEYIYVVHRRQRCTIAQAASPQP
jgi:hypothetical protein